MSPSGARLDLAMHERKPFAPGPYKLTPAESAALLAKVQQSMSSAAFGRLTVLELLDAYQDAKAAFLVTAMRRDPLRFATKSAGGGGSGEVASTASSGNGS